LVAGADLTDRWLAAGLICAGQFLTFDYGPRRFASVWSRESQMLCPIADSRSPGSKAEALAFAQALRDTRLIDHEVPLQDAIYVEKLSRLLPTYSISSRTSDDVVLGFWLTGGTNVSAKSFRRLRQTMSWLGSTHLKEVVDAAGVEAESTMSFEESEEQSLAEPDMIDQPAARSAADRSSPRSLTSTSLTLSAIRQGTPRLGFISLGRLYCTVRRGAERPSRSSS
jgi:hypothetical protein